MTDDPGADLTEERVRWALPGRPVRVYPALVSTEAEALAWAHQGAPEGALVVADYQVSARDRAGFVWETSAGEDLAFSLVLRPELPVHREGGLFCGATGAAAAVAGRDADIEWPDQVRLGGRRWAATTVRTEGEEHDIDVAVLTVLVPRPPGPRDELLGRLVTAIEERLAADEEETRELVVERCTTLGRSVTAHLVPMGPTGQRVSGLAVDIKRDGALVLRTREERRMAVRPHAVGRLEEAL